MLLRLSHVIQPVMARLGDGGDYVLDFLLNPVARTGGKINPEAFVPGGNVFHNNRAD